MIRVTYNIPFTSGGDMASQQTKAAFLPLNQGELEPLALPILSDVTTFDAPNLQFKRVVEFDETPEFIRRMGPPLQTSGPRAGKPTDAKCRAAVANLFTLKISKHTMTDVTEEIELLP